MQQRDYAWISLIRAIESGRESIKRTDVDDNCSEFVARDVLNSAEDAGILSRDSSRSHIRRIEVEPSAKYAVDTLLDIEGGSNE